MLAANAKTGQEIKEKLRPGRVCAPDLTFLESANITLTILLYVRHGTG